MRGECSLRTSSLWFPLCLALGIPNQRLQLLSSELPITQLILQVPESILSLSAPHVKMLTGSQPAGLPGVLAIPSYD